MNALPQPNPDRRAPRLNLSDVTPAVLRFEDGHRTQGQLEVISLTGGILVPAQTGGSAVPREVDVCDSDGAGARHRGNAEAGFLDPATLSFRGTRKGRPAAAPGLDPVIVWSSQQGPGVDRQVQSCPGSATPTATRLLQFTLAAFTLAMLSLGSAIYLSVSSTLSIFICTRLHVAQIHLAQTPPLPRERPANRI